MDDDMDDDMYNKTWCQGCRMSSSLTCIRIRVYIHDNKIWTMIAAMTSASAMRTQEEVSVCCICRTSSREEADGSRKQLASCEIVRT